MQCSFSFLYLSYCHFVPFPIYCAVVLHSDVCTDAYFVNYDRMRVCSVHLPMQEDQGQPSNGSSQLSEPSTALSEKLKELQQTSQSLEVSLSKRTTCSVHL